MGRSARPELRAELEQAGRGGAGETYSRRLSRTVRACATSSSTEDEFIRRARVEGLWVRPRFLAGTQEVVTGFAVAAAPAAGERAVWKGAGQLGRDLTLPRRRENWPDAPAHAAAAVEWRAAWRGAPVTTSGGRERVEPSARLWQTYTDDVARMGTQLATLDPGDHATWAGVATGDRGGVRGVEPAD